jgi:hypothetical protein
MMNYQVGYEITINTLSLIQMLPRFLALVSHNGGDYGNCSTDSSAEPIILVPDEPEPQAVQAT